MAITLTKSKRLQTQIDNLTGKTTDTWSVPQVVPESEYIKTLPDGTKINTLTQTATSPTGETSVIQDARAQYQNPNAGIIQMNNPIPIGREMSQQPLQQPLQQPIVQSEPQQKGFAEKVSDITLKPAEIAANLIIRGASLLAGQKAPAWENTAAELAKTTGGKVLGIATAVAAVAAAAAVTLAAAVPQVIAANVARTGVMATVFHSTVLKTAFGVAIGGRILSFPERMASDAKAGITSTVQTADLINDSVKAGLMSPQDAIIQYQQLESQLNSYETSMHTWNSINFIKAISGGGKDAEVDVLNAKINLQLKRQALMLLAFGVQQ